MSYRQTCAWLRYHKSRSINARRLDQNLVLHTDGPVDSGLSGGLLSPPYDLFQSTPRVGVVREPREEGFGERLTQLKCLPYGQLRQLSVRDQVEAELISRRKRRDHTLPRLVIPKKLVQTTSG